MTGYRGPGSRGGAFIAAVWLIGLGVVFLVQQVADLPWTEAWPLFVILVGAGSLASLLAGVRPGGRWIAELGWPIFLIVVGVLFLLSTTGVLGVGIGELVSRWWPLALIALGLWFLVSAVWPWGRSPESDGNRLSIPLGGAADAFIHVRFGGGELNAGPAPRGMLLTGEFEGAPAKTRSRGSGRLDLEPESPMTWPFWERTPRWQIGLATEVPLELQLDVGAARTRLDLSETLLRRLKISTGASDTRVTLPRAAGETFVKAEGGAASLTFEVPSGVAARVRSRMALGTTNVDARYPKVGDVWESADWGSAANRVEIDIQGGVGSARVVAL